MTVYQGRPADCRGETEEKVYDFLEEAGVSFSRMDHAPVLTMEDCLAIDEAAGFEIQRGEECFRPIRFYDVGALVWFAHIIEWEFPRFCVEKCFDRLLAAQRILEERGAIEAQIHRYLIVAAR